MTKKNVLLLTLVHPDFLPPVYATAQVLRDEGYHVHILTFDSFVPAEFELGGGVEVEAMGKHHDATVTQRLQLRNNFKKRASSIINADTVAIISFCPFSFMCGLSVKNGKPLAYIALEVADFIKDNFWNSPLSNFRNLRALNNVHKADFIATPSVQRSAWLAGRCHLGSMPYTILNTSYLPQQPPESSFELFRKQLPSSFIGKKVILYTGAVNENMCTRELVEAFDMVNDPDSVLLVTGVKDNEYGVAIKEFVTQSKVRERVKLFPYITRKEMLALQANADIGVYLSKEDRNNVKSMMIAPNKVGEYFQKNLYLLGIASEYLKPFEMKGIASVAASAAPSDISKAIVGALHAVNDKTYKARIAEYVQGFFSMQQQLKPLLQFLKKV